MDLIGGLGCEISNTWAVNSAFYVISLVTSSLRNIREPWIFSAKKRAQR